MYRWALEAIGSSNNVLARVDYDSLFSCLVVVYSTVESKEVRTHACANLSLPLVDSSSRRLEEDPLPFGEVSTLLVRTWA